MQRGKINTGSQQEFFTAGLNAYFRYYLIDEFAVNLRLNGKLRPDTIKLYDGQKRIQERLEGEYKRLSELFKINPEGVVSKFALPPEEEIIPEAQKQVKAPPEAEAYVRKNPHLKEGFIQKYGYLPEGM